MTSHRYGLIVLVAVAVAGALFASKIIGNGNRVEVIEASKIVGNGHTADNGAKPDEAKKDPASASKIIGSGDTASN